MEPIKIHYCVLKNPPPYPKPSQVNPAHIHALFI
jgi:hypothetical protein